jgi:hypothetical protein
MQKMIDDDTQPSEMPAVMRELHRIFGDPTTLAEGPRTFLMLPLQGDEDALAFLQTVPTGTPWSALADLAVAYRAAHPVPAESYDSPLSRGSHDER